MSVKYSSERREFLKNICKAGMLIPFASQFLPGGRVMAQGQGVRRLITIYYPNGAVLNRWHPKTIGRLSTRSNLNYALEPLQKFADRMITFRNLSTKGHGGSSSHPEAAGRVLSGGGSGVESYDVAIARQLGASSKLKYFHTGLFTRYNNGKDYLPFRDENGQSILPEDDPQKVLGLLFGSGAGGSNSKKDLQILEVIGDDLAKLRRIDLNSSVNKKIDAHEQALNYLEGLISNNLSASSSCRPLTVMPSMSENRRENNEKAEALVDAQFENIVAAFKCDLSAVASFQFMAAQDESLYINFDSIKTELDAADGGGFGSNKKWWNQNLSHSSSHEASGVFAVQNRWYNMMVAKLCEKMDAVADPLGGGSLLDTSTILVFSENGQSANHGMEDVAWYLMGGSNGAFDMGKVLDVRAKGSSDFLWELGRGMGLNWSRFGNSSSGIPGLYS